MFLAWNEIKSAKLRFSLIVGVLTLMSYLVFLLSGLANGMATLNREAVDQWRASAIILSQDASSSLAQSTVTLHDASGISGKQTAEIAQILATIRKSGTNHKESAVIMGVQKGQFIAPKVTEGRMFNRVNETVVADSLKANGLKLGDQLSISSSAQKLMIVGFTHNAEFNLSPVVYTSIAAVQKIKYGSADLSGKGLIGGIVVRDPNVDRIKVGSKLQVIPIESFIENIPGYTPEKITFEFMIYFLFVIVCVTIGIFLYVLTIHKTSIFGILKAQGISSGFLIRSVIAQTFLLAVFGVLAGFLFTVITGFFLPAAAPITLNYPILVFYGCIFILVAMIGSLFSVQTIVRIDPLKAIGG
ncbi:ABC transporter permease [Sporolactobacillus putidus]|uniref:Peptide ABC transporter permease n=1 Tax=Sporolactobacillus putidus TaxID=492735 RepID=A0A917S3G1_9BACL|nr:ABC transporter permease [Sporolactobacillus putidus]GGL54815.1 peptide ABC transporter permease [Sporolactobacillus putidus]